jgi:molecular chaperone GrpE
MRNEFDDTQEEDVEVASPEGEVDASGREKYAAAIEKLEQALEQKTREATEANDKYLRTYADFENYRKRMQRDQAEFRKYANEQLALDLLSVVDHLGLALKHAAEAGAGESNEGLRQGVELVYKQFRDALEKVGVKPFHAEGERFDPAKHDAVMQVTTADAPENTVVQVLQDGYLYHDKVLRHAKVGVSKKPVGTPEAESGEGPDEED